MADYYHPREDSSRPRALHQSHVPRPKAYIHEGSMFTQANGPFKSSFVIHPEWVSENKSRRNIKVYNASRRNDEYRYETPSVRYKYQWSQHASLRMLEYSNTIWLVRPCFILLHFLNQMQLLFNKRFLLIHYVSLWQFPMLLMHHIVKQKNNKSLRCL